MEAHVHACTSLQSWMDARKIMQREEDEAEAHNNISHHLVQWMDGRTQRKEKWSPIPFNATHKCTLSLSLSLSPSLSRPVIVAISHLDCPLPCMTAGLQRALAAIEDFLHTWRYKGWFQSNNRKPNGPKHGMAIEWRRRVCYQAGNVNRISWHNTIRGKGDLNGDFKGIK